MDKKKICPVFRPTIQKPDMFGPLEYLTCPLFRRLLFTAFLIPTVREIFIQEEGDAGWHRLCSCQLTVELAVASHKNIFHVLKST